MLRSFRTATIPVILPLVLVVACTQAGAAPQAQATAPSVEASTVTTAPATAVSANPPALVAQAPTPQGTNAIDWPIYHGNDTHTGVGPGTPAYSSIQQAWTANLDGEVYAEPLVVGSTVVAVTENDTVYALDLTSGNVLWSQHLGDPVPLSSLPCGNVDPSGLTSTPVVDESSGVLYVAGRMEPTHHELVALQLSTGNILFRRTIDPPGADPRYLQQRSGLALANDRVYIPFGGNWGDCGPYRGWVVGSAADGTGDLLYYGVPTEREGAIWGTDGAAIDSDGTLLVTTGNAASTTTFDFGNAVIRLSPDLQELDYWAPTDWAALSAADKDMGSIGPTLVDGGQVFQSGKNGVGYLLNGANLGGIGGELYQSPICQGAYSAAAYQSPVVYVPCLDGIVALQIGSGSFSILWHSTNANLAAPVVAYGSVWTIDAGHAQLLQLDPATGKTTNQYSLGGPITAHFITPTAVDGLLITPAGHGIIAWSGTGS